MPLPPSPYLADPQTNTEDTEDGGHDRPGSSGGGTVRGTNKASHTLTDLPTFEQQSAGTSVGVSWLPFYPDPSDPALPSSATTAFNPAARLLPKLVTRIEALKFVEMNKLLIEAWSTSKGTNSKPDRGLFGKLSCCALVTDIAIWSECFCLMAAVLTRRFPAKAPSLFAYMRRVVAHLGHSMVRLG